MPRTCTRPSPASARLAAGAALIVMALAAAPAQGAASTGGAQARIPGRAPVILSARCTPVSACEADPARVVPGGRLALTGHLSVGMLVVFRARDARLINVGVRARLRRSGASLAVTLPAGAASGHIYVIDRYGRRSASYGPIHVVRHSTTQITPPAVTSTGSAFSGMGMWIWHLANSEGGNLSALAARAKRTGVSTVYIKSSDGSTNYWSQFSSTMVATLKSLGLRVCAWQYVYGTHPDGEAALGARAVAAGADCLVIDAEAEYEGHYASAQTYIQDLRAAIGPNFPVGLASFPYVDYHPGLPYSVFLGPGGAQYNAPQMYWKDIGTSVDNVYAHTFTHNRIYQRPIFPLGQTYSNPSSADLMRFRQLAAAYGSSGLSWWDWEETSSTGWASLASPLAALSGFVASTAYPLLGQGAKGDEVVWMQQHLASAAPSTPTSGTFDATTAANLRSFQSSHRLPVSGQTDSATWAALLALAPVVVNWNGSTTPGTAARAATARAPSRSGPSRPASASLPALGYEIPRVG